MNKTIGIMAHVDAGKTTSAEQLLYHTKVIRKRGRVDHKDAFMDSRDIEKEHHGLLTGSPLTDIKVTLLTSRDHNKHTTGGDFREATFRALRQGLEKAENLLLEPYYDFKIKVGSNTSGECSRHTKCTWQL